jgi:hypothetical protein
MIEFEGIHRLPRPVISLKKKPNYYIYGLSFQSWLTGVMLHIISHASKD